MPVTIAQLPAVDPQERLLLAERDDSTWGAVPDSTRGTTDDSTWGVIGGAESDGHHC
ncbi:hypothetical protein OG689_44345 [Kitasatospora sp. NBC_00240]|uniref:hypothetical protein n=1 Tax=Kitasatospora sp. NBC_00240 TaxID=2903567 RepID=UPI00224E5011|nr:hypothetical protein [Kitasatospora sp. NBC_00240]MCX5216169.1 hypothetical protein [Kitasatospora sp. NBC_00240]